MIKRKMAFCLISAFCMIFASFTACQAKPHNYSQAQCKLLLVDKRFASKFRHNVTEKGVRMVYLNLKFGNDSYHPLESPRLLLPERWVWANAISEPMLSLPYDYDILSLGLLNYQVRSTEAAFVDQPTWCLAKMNLSCQHKVVARALLNNKAQSSDKTEVVCVQMIDTDTTDWVARLLDGNIIYQCCGKSKHILAEESSIRCELRVKSSSFYIVLNFVTIVFFLYWPALLLALPNSIFSLKVEYKKRIQLQARARSLKYGKDNASFQNEISESGHSSITGQDNKQNPRPNGNASGQDIKTVRVCLDNHDRNFDPQIDEDGPADEHIVYFLDATSPISCSTLFSEYTRDFSHSFSFNVKLAFLLYCVIPIVFYIDLGLNYTTKRNIFHELSTKPQANLGWQAILFNLPHIVYILTLLVYPFPTMFLQPKHFRLNGNCFACNGRDLFLGEEILKHLEKMQENIFKFGCLLIALQKRVLEKLLRYCSGSRNPHEANTLIIEHDKGIVKTFAECLWSAIVVAFFGKIMGVICLSAFVFVSLSMSIFYSPFVCFVIALLRRTIKKKTKGRYCYSVWAILVMFYFLGLLVIVSIIGVSSCRFIVRMFAFIIMGLIFNAEIAGPFVAFVFAASTNTYLCYYNLQIRYQDIKQMISQKWQEHGRRLGDNTAAANTDAIPARLFWHVCSNGTKAEHKVLPVMPEIIRMFRNMALILIFVTLSWCLIIFLGNTYNTSAVVATIALFVSGMIPRLCFKGLIKERQFNGPTKRRMMNKIEQSVKDYIEMVLADQNRRSLVIYKRRHSAPT